MTLRQLAERTLPKAPRAAPPVRAEDSRWSVVSSAVDLTPRPTDALIELALSAAANAARGPLTAVSRASGPVAGWLGTWPGEHYQLLAGLVEALAPRLVLEIGTFQGSGTLALAERMPATSRLVTFDIIDWRQIDGQLLEEQDFADGRITQVLGDLSEPDVLARHADLLREADLIFMDAPKDGRFEPRFLELARPLWQGRERYLVIDDIRLMPMVQLWRDLPYPKLDMTSFGHWSGTGLAVTQ